MKDYTLNELKSIITLWKDKTPHLPLLYFTPSKLTDLAWHKRSVEKKFIGSKIMSCS